MVIQTAYYVTVQIYVMKLNPLNASSDTALFAWPELTSLFAREEQHSRFEFRTVTVAATVPNIFNGLQVCLSKTERSYAHVYR